MQLAWIDLEMTGLDPLSDVIVEAAMIITNSELEVLHEAGPYVVACSNEQLVSMNETVRSMHQSSGLLDALRHADASVTEVEKALITELAAHTTTNAPVYLSGNSIATDRSFIKIHMPRLDAMLHYRQIDVTTVKLLAHAWQPDLAPFAKNNSHRALDDIRESVAELAYYRSKCFSLFQNSVTS